ncbi:hypothetical protein LCGC14_2174790 [marine sediment metagenome]|uniref:Uncharacterized protein n=1 Tax=marine sediment metagenome TaxID=412755 RepID=A0A0F9GJU5_9ZZZZ
MIIPGIIFICCIVPAFFFYGGIKGNTKGFIFGIILCITSILFKQHNWAILTAFLGVMIMMFSLPDDL